jgi:ketosteroid isomerase-like protein
MLGAACVTRTARLAPRGGATLGTPALIQDIVRQALALDAAGDRAADSLYAAEAVVVANARVRLAAPRFAGVGSGGRVTVAAAAVALEGRFAWVLADYRWINSQRNEAEAGRATVVCQQQAQGWKIVHVHSSLLLPWDR